MTMKKTLLFVGVVGMCISADAWATFANDSTTYPDFATGTYANVSTDNGNAPANTYRYAGKHQTDDSIKVKAATVKYVDSRSAEAQGFVDELTERADDDDVIVATNKTSLVGEEDWATNPNTTWEDKGLENNRQVTATENTECDPNNLDTYRFSGCGYIAGDASHIDGQTRSHYKWVKIATNCGVAGQEQAENCIGMSNNANNNNNNPVVVQDQTGQG